MAPPFRPCPSPGCPTLLRSGEKCAEHAGPDRPARVPCFEPTCPQLGHGGYCAEHEAARQATAEAKRGTAAQRGYDHQWRKVRQRFLARNPICGGCGAPSHHAHHIVPLKQGGARLDPSNLQALCHGCHNTAEARERREARR